MSGLPMPAMEAFAPPWEWEWQVPAWESDPSLTPWWAREPMPLPEHVVVEIDVIAEAITLGALGRAARRRDRQRRILRGALARLGIPGWGGWNACASREAGASTWVGWTAPPHPIDFVPSLNPGDSRAQQARSVIYSYHFDDDTRAWFDNSIVQQAFGAKSTEEMDPVRVIQAYEDKKDPVWKTLDAQNSPLYSSGGPGGAWKDLDRRIQATIARRKKLGPLPPSSYDTDPVVIYYYDHDRMKKIVWPRHEIPCALDPLSGEAKTWWRCGGDIFTYETQDPKKIAAERKYPGSPPGCYMGIFGHSGRDSCRGGGAGGWGDEGFDWNKDMPGNADVVFTAIASAVMEIIGAVLDVTGIGTALGIALNIAGAVVPALVGGIAGLIDAGFQGTDPTKALLGIAQALMQAAVSGFKAGTGVQIPPEALKAFSGTVALIAKDIQQAHQEQLDYSTTWNKIAAQASKYQKLGDKEAHAIAVLLGPDKAGKLFMQGYLVGKLASMPQIGAIASIVESYGTFMHDPKAFNIFLLGAGIGHLTAVQQGDQPKPLPPSAKKGSIAREDASIKLHVPKAPAPPSAAHRTGMAAFARAASGAAKDDLDTLVGFLESRYAGSVVGQSDGGAPVVWDPLAWGCPRDTWKDPLSGRCLPKTPLCPAGYDYDLGTGSCVFRAPGAPW